MELTYERSAENFILTALELELDEAGHIMSKDGEYIPTLCGKESIRIDKHGMFAHDEDGPADTKMVCDDITCIVNWGMESHMGEWEDPREGDEHSLNHMDILPDGETFCKKCGARYNERDQEIPEDAGMYWVPVCPDCEAGSTTNPPDSGWMEIISTGPTSIDVEQIHGTARLFHGRLAGMSQEELVMRAKWFDRQATAGKAWGPRRYRDIAFRLRRQARA